MKNNKISDFLKVSVPASSKFHGGKRQNTSIALGMIQNAKYGKDDYYNDDNNNNVLDEGECLHITPN